VVGEYAREVEAAWGVTDFNVRVGINSVPAAGGVVGHGDHQAVALGDATNVAARLESGEGCVGRPHRLPRLGARRGAVGSLDRAEWNRGFNAEAGVPWSLRGRSRTMTVLEAADVPCELAPLDEHGQVEVPVSSRDLRRGRSGFRIDLSRMWFALT
jgi:class 3 adenylate cyclase